MVAGPGGSQAAAKDNAKKDKERKAGGNGLGGGGAQYGADGADTPAKGPSAVDKKQKQREADAAKEKADAAAGRNHTGDPNKAGLPSTRPGAVPPTSLPPGMNPLKYTNKPTQSFAPTPSNLAKVAGSAVGTLTSPAVSAVGMGISALTDDEYDPLNPFEKPEGMVGGAATAETSELEGQGTLGQSEFAPDEVKKKKKPAVPTLSSIGTLLSGVGGTLVAG